MSTELQQYRAWERTGPFVHVMKIERGDRSAAFRLTLTDKPYYDKGVSGTKYHDTYPAPIHCIRSDITSDESMTGTTFGEIVLANGSGLLDGIQGFPNIIGQTFEILRGSPDWSLMETDYPNRFDVIQRGQIDGINLRKNGAEIVLQVSARRYLLDHVIAGPADPVALGACRNVPATLVDSGLLQYRFSTIPTDDTSFVLRDAGVELVVGVGNDYELVDESGQFKGLVELASPPSGDLTADIESDLGNTGIETLVQYVWTAYVAQDDLLFLTLDATGELTPTTDGRVFISPDAAKIYLGDDSDTYQYTLDTGVYDSKSFAIDDPLVFKASGEYMYSLSFNQVSVRQLSTPNDIDTAGSVLSSQTLALPAGLETLYGAIVDFYVTDDEDAVWLLSSGGKLLVYDIGTPRDLTTASLSAVHDLYRLAGTTSFACFDLSGDRLHLYILTGSRCRYVVQLDLMAAEDLTTMLNSGRAYSYPHTRPCWMAVHPTDPVLYLMNEDTALEVHILPAVNQLPPRTLWQQPSTGTLIDVAEYLNSETQLGAVLESLLSNITLQFSVGRLGDMQTCRYLDPQSPRDGRILERWDLADWVHIEKGDCVGPSAGFINQVAQFPAVGEYTITYDRNWFIQQASSLAGSVSADDVEYYSKPHLSVSDSITLAGYSEPAERLYETRIAGQSDAEAFLEEEVIAWSTERAEYEIECLLSAVPLYEDFGVGRLVTFGDLGHPAFRVEPYLALYHILSTTDDFAESADSEANSFSGDFRIRMRVQFLEIGNMTDEVIVAKGNAATDVAFKLKVVTGGKLRLVTSANGTTLVNTTMATSLEDIDFNAAKPIWLMINADLDNGSSARAVQFAYCYWQGLDLPPADAWNTIEVVGGSVLSALHDSGQPITIGATADNAERASDLRVSRLYIDAAGTPASDFDARRWKTGDTLGSSVAGEEWVLNGYPIYPGYPRALVTGRRVNWSKGVQTLRVFK